MPTSAPLLIAALFAYGWYLRGGPFGPAFLAHRRFARLAARSATLFGGGALLMLAAMGRLGSVAMVPAEFAPPAATAGAYLPGLGEPIGLALIVSGLLIGGGIGAVASRWRGRVFALGTSGRCCRNRAPKPGWAAVLAVAAGVSEELFFRLLLPLSISQVTGSAWIGAVGATALFGVAHRYQGWIGVAATTCVGVVLTAIYLASGRLWMAVALHMAINLNGLVLRPLATGIWRGR